MLTMRASTVAPARAFVGQAVRSQRLQVRAESERAEGRRAGSSAAGKGFALAVGDCLAARWRRRAANRRLAAPRPGGAPGQRTARGRAAGARAAGAPHGRR
jgi:hypothetical protein